MSPPSVKQHLAGHPYVVRLDGDGPGHALKPCAFCEGPRRSVSKGVTPVLSSEDVSHRVPLLAPESQPEKSSTESGLFDRHQPADSI
jgi:hypothetical protein